MNPITMAGAFIVTLALIFYTLFIIQEVKQRKATSKLLRFLTLGVIFDISATVCMIVGSPNSPFTLHGFIGYISLLGMLIDAILIWRHKLKNGSEEKFSDSLHLFSKIAYWVWVLLAYVTGSALVVLSKMS